MISNEQLKLANEVKDVHLYLRKRSQEVGVEQAWKEHLSRGDVLEKYSKSMKKLAEEYWDKNNQGDRAGFCRINWVANAILNYYCHGGYKKEIHRDLIKFNYDSSVMARNNCSVNDKIRLLDVGSCYNPLKKFDFIESYALDLCPASPDVMKGNFLNLQITDDATDWYRPEISKLPENFFDVVVFCLFLEYLPSPCQRLHACKTAWSVLREGGMLLIVTPDSKHQNANAHLMKTWKIALGGIGFIRLKIEKLRYLYCMSFRKTSCTLYRRLPEYDGWENAIINTPQDAVNYLEVVEKVNYENIHFDVMEGFHDIFNL